MRTRSSEEGEEYKHATHRVSAPPILERGAGFIPGNQRPADVLVPGRPAAAMARLDVTVISPCCIGDIVCRARSDSWLRC